MDPHQNSRENPKPAFAIDAKKRTQSGGRGGAESCFNRIAIDFGESLAAIPILTRTFTPHE